MIKSISNNIKHQLDCIDDGGFDYVNKLIKLVIELEKTDIHAKIKQGWTVNKDNNFEVVPYLYIKALDNEGKTVYVDMFNNGHKNVSVSKHLQSWIYKRKPSVKRIENMKRKYKKCILSEEAVEC